MNGEKGKCNVPILGQYLSVVVGYCALPEDHTDRHQCAQEVQGGYRNVAKEPEDSLVPTISS